MAMIILCSTSEAQSAGELAPQGFFDALVRADSTRILQFLEDPDNLIATDEQGNTALHLAVQRGFSFAAELLLAHGADITARNSLDQTPLEMPPSDGRRSDHTSAPRIAAVFVRHHLQPAPAGDQRRAELRLRMALRARDEPLVRAATGDGADPSARIDSFGNTVLHDKMWASMVPLVVELGGDVNLVNKLGETPLRTALKRGDTSMSAALLDAGATLDDDAEVSDLLFVIRTRSNHADSLVDLLLDAGAPVRHDEWLAAMGSRNKDIVRSLWRHSPFDPTGTGSEELIAEAVRLGGDEVMAVLRSDPELAAFIKQRDAKLQQGRESDIHRYMAWLAPHLLVISGLVIGFALLSCLPASLLVKSPKGYGLCVGISTALLTHLFIFTPFIEASLTEFRLLGERIPSLRHFAFAIFDGTALSVGWAIAALVRKAAAEWIRRPAVAAVAISSYIAAVGILGAHNTQAISWPTTAYQHVTGFTNAIAREEEQRAKRAAMAQEENAHRAGAPHAPLFIAVEQNDSPAVVAALGDGLPVDTRNERGDTALFVAASDWRLVDVIPTLLAAGADPNALHEGGRRPVHAVTASGIGHRGQELMKLLIAAGADINARTDAGRTPLCSAHRQRHTADSQAYFLWLLEQGAYIKYSDPCATAAYTKNSKFFLPLLQKTANDINQRRPFARLNDQFGFYEATPLWRAAYENRIDSVTLLLALSADIESRDTKRGMTPLQLVVEHSQYNPERLKPMLDLLIAEGANTRAIAWDGSKLLDCEQQCRLQTSY